MASFVSRMRIGLLLALMLRPCRGFSSGRNYSPYRPQNPTRVLVTGATGRTGMLVFTTLLEDPRFNPIGMVRTEKRAKKFIKATNCALDQVVVCDVTELKPKRKNGVPEGLEDTKAMVICTSAVPYLCKKSLIKALLKIPLNILRGRKMLDFRSLRFKFKHGQSPEMVDYNGQKAQIDLAKKLGMRQVVIVSSMGGSDPDNFLNSVGKEPDGSGDGDMLLWKRKAERYLVESGLHYTIIHPGGLIDTPPGIEGYELGVDDKLFDSDKRSIGRADVANLCVAALSVAKDRDISFDCITRPVGRGINVKSAEEVLSLFLRTGQTTDYNSC